MGDPEIESSENSRRGGVPDFRLLEVEGSRQDLDHGLVAMSLNEPRLGGEQEGACVVEGALAVRGWAHARGGIAAVFVVIDGRRYEALRPVVRTDLLDHYGPDTAREGGFALQLHPRECPPGTHALAVVAVGHEGDTVGVEGEIDCRPDPLASDTPPPPVATVDWIEERTIPRENPHGADPVLPTTPASPTELRRLHGLALMWESRALLAEADGAASRIEAGLASEQQTAAIRALREAEARVRELEAELATKQRALSRRLDP